MDIREMNEIKEKRGYSFSQLSSYSGVPVVTLQKIFSGKTKNPRRATLDAIERVLKGDESVYQGKAFEYGTEGLLDDNGLFDSLKEPGALFGGKKPGEFTIDDYNKIPEDKRVELIDGVLFEMNSPTLAHQDIIYIIHSAIAQHIKNNKGKCKVYSAPADVQLNKDNKTMVVPDVIVVCDRDKIKGFGIYGAPDFIAEILSPSTRYKDLSIKVMKYADAGVREYWIVDPKKKVLIVYNFMEEDWTPEIHPLEGEMPVAIYEGKLKISLDVIAEAIEEYEGLED